MLFHVSEHPGIERFDPRRSEYAVEPVVWAIDAARLRNYLLPRDCPRVTFYAGPHTEAGDRENATRRDRTAGAGSSVMNHGGSA